MIGKAAIFLGVAFALNKAMWGNKFGDDDTPFGAVKTGKTADGKTSFMDLTALTGLTRGMRQIGLLAMAEGWRQGTSPERIGDKAFENFYTALLHPAEGPIVGAAHTLATGRNLIGQSVVQNPPPSGSHVIENLQAAGIQANPATAALWGQSRHNQDMTWAQRAANLLGPYNPFKQRGDAVLAEMHGRLREIEDARKVFQGDARNVGRMFPQEAEYDVLHKMNAAIGKLEDVMKGRERSGGSTVQLTRPEAAQVAMWRAQINQLARQALQIQASVRR